MAVTFQFNSNKNIGRPSVIGLAAVAVALSFPTMRRQSLELGRAAA
ncbi:hypothetical protein RAD16_01490 [Bradyrhizobium sp. 18BD]